MKITPFGKELRKIRIDNDLTMNEMSKKLDLSVKVLSAIEHGKKEIPNDFIDKLSKTFEKIEVKKMKNLALEQTSVIAFDLNTLTEYEKATVTNLYRSIFINRDELNLHQSQDIIKILKWTPSDKMMRWINSPEAHESITEYIEEENTKENRKSHWRSRISKLFSNTEELEDLIGQCVRENREKLVWTIFDLGFEKGEEYEPEEEPTFATYTKKFMDCYFEKVNGQGTIYSILNSNFEVLWQD